MRKTLSRNQLENVKPFNFELSANLPPDEVLRDTQILHQSDIKAKMAAVKAALQTMEEKCADYRLMFENRVRSLNEMKRKQAEADTDEERRELKIAVDSLENIIATDKTTLFDMDTACKELRKELEKAEDEEVIQEDDMDLEGSEAGEKEKTFTREVLETEFTRRNVASLNSKFDRLCSALADGRGDGGRGPGEDGSSRGPTTFPERKRILGALPSFITGTTDFQLHLEAFRDVCVSVFLTTLDQTPRLRCSGLEPDKAPCNTMGYVKYLDRLKEMFVPKANLLITQQAFHERRQKSGKIPADNVMSKWSLFKRGWSNPPAPFSFYYEACTAGLLDEALRNETYREQTRCDDSNDRTLFNAAFQSYLERVQQCVAYIRRTCSGGSRDQLRGQGHHLPDHRRGWQGELGLGG